MSLFLKGENLIKNGKTRVKQNTNVTIFKELKITKKSVNIVKPMFRFPWNYVLFCKFMPTLKYF